MNELKSRVGDIEYRVREVKRYIVTRYGIGLGKGGCLQSSTHGEFDNWDTAYQVGYALCKKEHDDLGYPPGDERIQYPDSHGPDYPWDYGKETESVTESQAIKDEFAPNIIIGAASR